MENIKIENLSFCYPTSKVKALNNITMTINKGEFVLICGKSGCGKTTLLRMLKPIIAPYGEKSGSVIFDGAEITELSNESQAEKIGFVFQNPDEQLVCDKVWHELAFGLESLGYKKEIIRRRVAEMSAFFGIEELFNKNVADLSGGQKQILNLASVMTGRPEVLILDEPISQLDPISAEKFINMLVKINKELGTTIICSEHRLENLLEISDRVCVLNKGELMTFNEPKKVCFELFNNGDEMCLSIPTSAKVYLACNADENAPLNIRDGKAWLENMEVKNEIKKSICEINSNEKIIEIKELFFRYEKNEKDVLKNLSLNIAKGDSYAIVGGNGYGKSTLATVICGINKPYRGKVKIEKGKTVSYLPQNPECLFSKKSVQLELESRNADRLDEIIELCELEELLGLHPFDLSGGEKQRLALAIVLLSEPDIIILDEPTKGLDAFFKEKLGSLLQKLNEKGITIILVSHDIEFCAKYAKNCGMLFDGQIIAEGETKEFFLNNSLYTTSAKRLADGKIENAVFESDILYALGK